MIIVRGAEVLTPDGLKMTNVLISGANVTHTGIVESMPEATVIEARGYVLGPGLVDMHTHLREPGESQKEDVESGSRAAAAGGFTAVVSMPNTTPPIDSPHHVELINERSHQVGLVDVVSAGAITRGRRGEELADISALYEAGVRIFTDDGDAVADPALMRKAMDAIRDLPGALIAEHAEDPAMTTDGHINMGPMAEKHGVGGLAAAAEISMIARDIELVRESGSRLHVQHVSTAGGVDLVAAAKQEGLEVSAEVTPHHLVLTEASLVDADPNFKMYPPLRTAGDRDALRAGLFSKAIDVVATDHAPHTAQEKAMSLQEAPRGVIGLETALPIVSEALGGDIEMLFERMSQAPARLASLPRHGQAVAPGSPANLVLIDPNLQWTPERFESKSANSPFMGWRLTGRAVLTVYEGRIIKGTRP